MFDDPQAISGGRYGPVGVCIYCRSERGLSAEHIIPFSLDGTLQLTKATCAACAAATCKLEGIVSRTMFGNFRLKHDMPSRRKSARPQVLPLTAIKDGVPRSVLLPIAKHAAVTPLLWYGPPGALNNKKEDYVGIIKLNLFGSGEQDLDALDADSVVYKANYDAVSFARFLAKVAHGVTVLELGLDGFAPLLAPTIFDKSVNPFFLVGGELDVTSPVVTTSDRTGHEFSLTCVKTHDGRLYTAVRLRLFANWISSTQRKLGMPVYWVVTGKQNGLTQQRARSGPFYSIAGPDKPGKNRAGAR